MEYSKGKFFLLLMTKLVCPGKNIDPIVCLYIICHFYKTLHLRYGYLWNITFNYNREIILSSFQMLHLLYT